MYKTYGSLNFFDSCLNKTTNFVEVHFKYRLSIPFLLFRRKLYILSTHLNLLAKSNQKIEVKSHFVYSENAKIIC